MREHGRNGQAALYLQRHPLSCYSNRTLGLGTWPGSLTLLMFRHGQLPSIRCPTTPQVPPTRPSSPHEWPRAREIWSPCRPRERRRPWLASLALGTWLFAHLQGSTRGIGYVGT